MGCRCKAWHRFGDHLVLAFQFALDESSEAGLRRIADEQISKILIRLTGRRSSPSIVHGSRKALKRLRALFKLVRSGLPKRTYNLEYGVIRDAGRALSGVRDLEVLPLTLASLSASRSKIDDAAVEAVRLAIERAAAANGMSELQRVDMGELVQDLESARLRYAELSLSEPTFRVLQQGAAAGLRKLGKQYRLAVESNEEEAYHDWRKSAQLHWRHMRLLLECWPRLMTARIAVGKGLAGVLGHDHDLSVLAEFISKIPTSRLRAARRKALLEAICDRQQFLRAEARAYAGVLLSDEPAVFAASLSGYREARLQAAELQAPLCDVFELPIATTCRNPLARD